MIKIEKDLIIKRPIAEVFAFMTNSENDPQWQSGIEEVRKTSEGPIGVGTTFIEVNQMMGRRIESTIEYTEYEVNRKISLKSVSGPIPFKMTGTFERISDDETRVALIGEGDVSGFFKLAEPLISGMFNKQMESNTAKLKKLLDAHAESAA